MTDAAGDFLVPSETRLELLKRIAASLGVAEDAFFALENDNFHKLQIISDTEEIIDCFVKMDSHQLRRQCINYAKSIITKQDK